MSYLYHSHTPKTKKDQGQSLGDPRRDGQWAGLCSMDNYHLIFITEEIENPFNYQCINANNMQFINQQAIGDPVESLVDIQDCSVHRHSPVNRCHQTISRRAQLGCTVFYASSHAHYYYLEVGYYLLLFITTVLRKILY